MRFSTKSISRPFCLHGCPYGDQPRGRSKVRTDLAVRRERHRGGGMRNRFCGLVVLSVVMAFSSPLANAQTVALGTPTIAQIPSPLSLEVRPAFDLPLADSANWFTYGGGMNVDMNYHLPSSIFFFTGGLQYAYVPDQASDSLSIVAARFGGGVQVPLTKGISVMGFATGGYYFSTLNSLTASASDPYAAGGVGMKFSLGTSLSLNIVAEYDYFFGLYQGISAAAGKMDQPRSSPRLLA